jgi:hypothetical protein
LAYRSDAEPGKWTATCIGCRRPEALIVTEQHDDGPITVGCRCRCREPVELAAMLEVDPDVIAAQAETRRWLEFATRTVDRFIRHIELDAA